MDAFPYPFILSQNQKVKIGQDSENIHLISDETFKHYIQNRNPTLNNKIESNLKYYCSLAGRNYINDNGNERIVEIPTDLYLSPQPEGFNVNVI
jgi:hypothetical protein